MKKLLLFLLVSLVLPQFALSQYFFSTDNINPDEPCCVWIKVGNSNDREDTAWSVEVDGATYNFEDYSPIYGGAQIYYCFEENGIYTIDFNVEGYNNPYWSQEVEINACKETCCDPPSLGDLTVTAISDNLVEVCLPERENCAGMEANFQCRKKGETQWMYFNNETYCATEYVESCVTYEFRGQYWSSECSLTEWSEIVEYTAPGTNCNCCDIIPQIDYRMSSCNSMKVCVSGYENCDVRYVFMQKKHNSNNWQMTTSISGIASNCFTFTRLRSCETYDFSAVVLLENCPNKVLTIKRISFDESCCGGISQPKDNDFNLGISHEIETMFSTNISAKTFPNPFKQSFQIEVLAQQGDRYQLSLFNVQGKVLKTIEGNVHQGTNVITIDDLAELNNGVYYYKLQVNEQVISNKVVKN